LYRCFVGVAQQQWESDVLGVHVIWASQNGLSCWCASNR
jgi:hypothetical protein